MTRLVELLWVIAAKQPESKMQDFLIIHAEFSATEFTIEPASEKGIKEFQRRFGECCTSINVKKLHLPHYVGEIKRAGFLIA